MKESFRKVFLFFLLSLILNTSIGAAFSKPYLANNSTDHSSLQKENLQKPFALKFSFLAEEAEKKESETDADAEYQSVHYLSLQGDISTLESRFLSVVFSFLNIKSLLHSHLFILFHCLKIPCN